MMSQISDNWPLVDRAAPLDAGLARRLTPDALGANLGKIFADFDTGGTIVELGNGGDPNDAHTLGATEDESVDMFVARRALGWIAQVPEMVASVASKLKPGGRIVSIHDAPTPLAAIDAGLRAAHPDKVLTPVVNQEHPYGPRFVAVLSDHQAKLVRGFVRATVDAKSRPTQSDKDAVAEVLGMLSRTDTDALPLSMIERSRHALMCASHGVGQVNVLTAGSNRLVIEGADISQSLMSTGRIVLVSAGDEFARQFAAACEASGLRTSTRTYRATHGIKRKVDLPVELSAGHLLDIDHTPIRPNWVIKISTGPEIGALVEQEKMAHRRTVHTQSTVDVHVATKPA